MTSHSSGPLQHDPVTAARAWLAEDGAAALATVMSTWNSAPVPAGAQLAVAKDGRFEGSVSGGCIEADVITAAAGVIASGRGEVLEFGVDHERAWQAGLACGGQIAVYVEPLTRVCDLNYLDTRIEARAKRTSLVVSTALETGTRTVFTSPLNAPDGVRDAFTSGECRISGEGRERSFCQAVLPVVHLVIAGATEIGQVLARLALPLGWKISVVDPRAAFATAERFPGVETHVAWPEAALGALGLDPRTAIVALTHASNIDDETLTTALSSSCFYAGALGSKRNHAGRVERLKAAGFSADAIARIRAPAGLDIKAKSPAEIAISILAQIVAAQRGG